MFAHTPLLQKHRRVRVLVGHGSRAPFANAAFETFAETYRSRHPGEDIVLGYLQLAKPALEEVLRDLATRAEEIVLLPVFLFAAGHVKNDLPLTVARVQRDFPRVQMRIARAMGVHEQLVALLGDKLEQATGCAPGALRDTQVAVVGRGSSDADANSQLAQLTRLFAERFRLPRVELCFEAVASPSVTDSLELLVRARPRRIVLLPYLLFKGVLVRRLHEHAAKLHRDYPWIECLVAEPLGLDRRLLDVFDERAHDALHGDRPLPCTSCAYRTSTAEVVQRVDGLSALLYSVRHSLTHSQASPHEHAHKPIRKHVLVCGNVDCAARGSLRMLGELRRQLKQRELHREIKVTRTSCMGLCGEGPAVAVYPDGVWYRSVSAKDAPRLIDEHLVGGQLVSDLVDNIMT